MTAKKSPRRSPQAKRHANRQSRRDCPRKTRILDQDIKVMIAPIDKCLEEIDAENDLPPGSELHGFFAPSHNLIAISSDDSIDQRRDTLIHESLHAICHVLGINIPHEKIHLLGATQAQILKPWMKPVK